MRVSATLVALVVGASVASAQPTPPQKPIPPQIVQQLPKGTPAIIGLTEAARFTASTGFIDDVVASDDTAARLAYVVADAAAKAELHVVTLATNTDQVVDLAAVTLHPIALAFVGKDKMFVVGQTEDGLQMMAALVDLAEKTAGKAVYKLPPATHIALQGTGAQAKIVVHRAVPTKTGGMRHEIDLVAVGNGKRTQAGRGIELDGGNGNKALEFRVNSWGENYTRAYGMRSGAYNAKTDHKDPDVEATYDLIAGKIIDTAPIGDLFEQRRRFQGLNEAVDKRDFVRLAWDNSGVQVWKAAKSRAIELDQPMVQYDPKSLQGLVAADGSAWILLKVDPVNPAAVGRKKADLEYLDLFHVGTDTKAQRKARIFAPGVRHYFGVIGDKIWLLERNNGFDRGAKSLTIYTVAP